MAKNVGTLVSSPIRPNDSDQLIASALANEIQGGVHSVTSSTDRDAIFNVRREWGMLCYVINDNTTYQLEYGYADTDITNDLNWKVFTGSGGGSLEWIDSVLSVLLSEPISPTDGDRYIIGRRPTDIITGINWSLQSPGTVAEWSSSLNSWIYTNPTDNTSVRVDDEDNSIYRYEGIFPTGAWQKEKESQVRYVFATQSGPSSYSATIEPSLLSYDREIIYITKFSAPNIGASVSLNINGLGDIIVKKTDGQSLLDIITNEITTNYQYMMSYNGTYFELSMPSSSSISTKFYLDSTDYIVVPPRTEYWIYGDLTIDNGTLENYGHVIVANGSLNLINSGQFINSASYSNLYFAEINGLGQTNYVPRWVSPYMLTATSSITDDTQTVNITSTTFSINSNILIPTGASAGYLLTSDANGVATWQPSGVNINKFSATYSFVANATQSISHNLNSETIVFNFWNETNGEQVIVYAKKDPGNSANVLLVNSSVTVPNGRVVIIG
jgi:hypothetical protein